MSARSHRHIAVAPSAKPAKGGSDRNKNAAAKKKKIPPLPRKPEEMSWRDYLIMLLHIAAELEHGLMVEYLFAAYSLGGPGAAEEPQVVDWRDKILTVAREEMGHLITVQNLLLLIGGPITFEREDFPWSSPFYPFEFKLERLTLKSLACYVYAEMPQNLTLASDKRVKRDVLALIRTDAPTVGEVYDRIIKLVGNETLIPDSMFDADSYKYQATWDEWGRGYRPGNHKPYAADPAIPPRNERKTTVIVAQMATRTEALQALQAVAGQGEAEDQRTGKKEEPSHFDRFRDIFVAYQNILKKKPKWSPSRAVATNPYAGEARFAPSGTTPITSTGSIAWGSLFNIRYRALLLLLTYIFRIPRDAPDTAHFRRAQMLSRMFGEMYNMKAIAGILVRLPLGDPRKAPRAGPPFQFPYTLSPPLPEENFWRTQLDLLATSEELIGKLLDPKHDYPGDAPADGERYLLVLRQTDAEARTSIEQIIAGITSSKRARA